MASAGVSNAVALTVWTAARSPGSSARISTAFNRRSRNQKNKRTENKNKNKKTPDLLISCSTDSTLEAGGVVRVA